MIATRMTGSRLIQKVKSRSEQSGDTEIRFLERLGQASLPKNTDRIIWFHARDTQSALPLFSVIEQLNDQDLGIDFLLTTRRHEDISKLIQQLPENTIHQFLPVDLDKPITSFIKYWSPEVAVISEGEYWPRILTRLAKTGVPIISINAKMSEKSYKRWLWIPGLAKSVLLSFDLILAQDLHVAQKLRHLGAKAKNIRVTGSMTTAKKLLPYDDALYSSLSAAIGTRPVWLAAATSKSEENVIVNAHKVAMRKNRRLLLLLHTHHAKRSDEIASRHEHQNINFSIHKNGEALDESTDIYITNQSDNLGTYMRLASVTFCGGSLSNGDTTDPFHPASMGSAIIYGPSTGIYEEDYARYSKSGAAELVQNGGQLSKTLNKMLSPDVSAAMAYAAWEISSEGGDVSGIVTSEILEKLAERSPDNAAA